MAVAAFFDLDRTLLAESSGLLLMEACVELGLVSDRERQLADLGGRAYNRVGETWIGMQITKRGVQRFAGWELEQLREAARRSADKMEAALYREARELIARHQKQGHLAIVATSTGREIVEPLVDRLGVDGLIATEYEVNDGKLTGSFDGKWLWGPDKADAITAFAQEHDVDLDVSYGYSDAYFDRPMFELVGHPRPVNPDAALRALAIVKGWPVLDFGARQPLVPDIATVLRPLSNPLLSPVRISVEGIERIPTEGPVIVAGNHRSYLDPVVLSTIALRRGRMLRYLGKKEVFDIPLIGQLAHAFGQIRVERGTGATQPLEQAIDALMCGDAIGIFPQGTIPRGRKFFESKLDAKTGVARLAITADAPVVPVAMWGAEDIWPRSSRIPKPDKLLRRPVVHARVGEPLMLHGEDYHAEAERVMDTIAAMLPDEVRDPPPPTPEQIKAAWPANIPLPDEELRA